MKTKFSIITFIIVALALPFSANAWSSKGHQTVALIAKQHLSTKAYRQINEILNGTSIVYYASWLDYASREDEYLYTSTWHYINVDAGQDYYHRQSLSFTDAVQALAQMKELLLDQDSTNDQREFAIKVIVHVIGDLHQPLHTGHYSDRGGNYITLYYNDESTNLHSFWDYSIVEAAHPWSYYQWQQTLDTLPTDEVTKLQAGTLDDWAIESTKVAAKVYDYFKRGTTVTDNDIDFWTPCVEEQLLKGGLRLAKYLNDIFSTDASLEEVEIDRTTPKLYYDINGIPQKEPTKPGIYITSEREKLYIGK